MYIQESKSLTPWTQTLCLTTFPNIKSYNSHKMHSRSIFDWCRNVVNLYWVFDLSSQWKLNLSKKCRKKSWSTHLCVFPIFCFSFSLLLFLLLFLFRCLLFSKLCWTRFLFFYILVHNICWSIFFLFTLRIFIRLPIIYIQLKGESYQLLG